MKLGGLTNNTIFAASYGAESNYQSSNPYRIPENDPIEKFGFTWK